MCWLRRESDELRRESESDAHLDQDVKDNKMRELAKVE